MEKIASWKPRQLWSSWGNPQNLNDPGRSSPWSQEPSVDPYPEPHHSSTATRSLSLSLSLLVPSIHLSIGLRGGLVSTGFPTKDINAVL
jgi:hypothetical protein